MIAQAVEAVEPQLRAKGHRLSTMWSSDEPLYVNGDLARLVQCVGNVLNNAVKYTAPGGEISIRARPDANDACIEISDNGSGISPELLPHVFDLFVQSDHTLERSGGGLGIGLAVVQRLLEMHEGSVQARSAGMDQGSVFEIRLPRIARPMKPLSENARSTPKPKRVLIVEDNVDAAESLAALLKVHRYEVHVVHNGAEALACIGGLTPDVALIDLGLPGMSGYELAERLRTTHFPDMRLVALTGYGQPEERTRSRRAGFDDHLIKPVDLSSLAAAMSGPRRSRRLAVSRRVQPPDRRASRKRRKT